MSHNVECFKYRVKIIFKRKAVILILWWEIYNTYIVWVVGGGGGGGGGDHSTKATLVLPYHVLILFYFMGPSVQIWPNISVGYFLTI